MGSERSVNLFRNGGTLGQGSLAGGAECAPLCSGTCWGPPCQVVGTGTRMSRVRPVIMIFSGAEPPIFSNFQSFYPGEELANSFDFFPLCESDYG